MRTKSRSFGELLREARLKRQVSQKQLSDRLGICQAKISDMENNSRGRCPETMLEVILEFLSVTKEDEVALRTAWREYPAKKEAIQDLFAVANRMSFDQVLKLTKLARKEFDEPGSI